jgi:lipoprotein-releasing system permease protein
VFHFESLLGQRYLQRSRSRPKIFWVGLISLGLSILIMFSSSYLKLIANPIAYGWHQSWWLRWLGNDVFEIEYALVQISYIGQIIGLAGIIINVLVLLFGMLNWRFTTFSAFSTFMIATGVTEVLLVLGVMNGFQGYLRNKLVDAHAHISIEPLAAQEGLSNYQSLLQKARQVDGVLGVSPVLITEVMLRAPDQELTAAAQLIGVNPSVVNDTIPINKFLNNGCGCLSYLKNPQPINLVKLEDFSDTSLQGFCKLKCSDLTTQKTLDQQDQILTGSLDKKEQSPNQEMSGSPHSSTSPLIFIPPPQAQKPTPSLLLGVNLRYTLGLMPGQTVEVISPMGDIGPQGPMPKLRDFRVAGWLNAGLVDVDSHQIYAYLPEVQKFLGMTDQISEIRIRVASIDVARQVRDRLIQVMGPQVRVRDWQERNQSLFSALQLERIAMFLVLTINILLAAFSITSTLVMTLIERRREIAILSAMGAEPKSIHRIFVYQGLSAGIIGSILGVITGGSACWIVATMGLPLNTEEIYYISAIPVSVNVSDVLAIVSVALSVSLISTLYPAYYASKIKPLEGLKGR